MHPSSTLVLKAGVSGASQQKAKVSARLHTSSTLLSRDLGTSQQKAKETFACIRLLLMRARDHGASHVGKNCSPADVFSTAFSEDGCWYFTAEDTEGKGACSSADVFNPALKGKGPCKGKDAGKRDLAKERDNDA